MGLSRHRAAAEFGPTRDPSRKREGGRLLALALVSLGVVQPAAAAPDPQAFAALQRLDARVQSIGWRLVRGNAPFCAAEIRAIGLQLHDVYGYADPSGVRRALALTSDVAVEAVAADGPAARAGLAANDSLAEVAGQPVAALPRGKPGDYGRLAGLHDRIDAALAKDRTVELAVLRDGRPRRLTIPGEKVCASRFEMLTEGNRAAADGRRVVVSRKLVEFLPADEELAALLAHELAHNLLGHRTRLDAQGRTWGNVRTTEREADRLSVWLLANAGYDPAAALRFMARWGPPNDLGIFSSPDHDRWKTRLRAIEAELARLAQATATAGDADWPDKFVPQERLEREPAQNSSP